MLLARFDLVNERVEYKTHYFKPNINPKEYNLIELEDLGIYAYPNGEHKPEKTWYQSIPAKLGGHNSISITNIQINDFAEVYFDKLSTYLGESEMV